MGLKDERGGIVKWLITLVILGVVLFDAGAIAVNTFGLDSTANDIANEVSTGSNLNQVNNEETLRLEAKKLAKEADARLVKFDVGNDKIIRLQLRRRARTLLVHRIDAISSWGRATADGQASAN